MLDCPRSYRGWESSDITPPKWSPSEQPFNPRCKPMLTHSSSRIGTVKYPQYEQERHWFPSLPFQQFQVLFNSLFKVLCIFPSRYLFAIGLPPIFSFRWNLPPTLSCNPKQLDSLIEHVKVKCLGMYGSLTLSAAVFQRTYPKHRSNAKSTDHNSNIELTILDSQGELFPLQSPLLGESWLVSFPPLINMLKFSGSSYLI